ncbi:MAG: polyphenol oxidase family protein [bacterium]|nr:polyphenol oxidase family protein [bacterium]MDE0667661.1 polyphenol oxidase family protein [bacterium]
MLALTLELNGGGRAEVRVSDRRDGDFADCSVEQQASLAEGTWTKLRQQHSARVVTVTAPGDADGSAADAAVTATPGAVLTVRTADCAPVALVAAEGVVAVAHAGWRGLAAGVLEQAAAAVRRLGGRQLSAYVGPCIGPECYEFGQEPLGDMVERFGPQVAARTAWGTPALDIPAAVRTELARSGVGHLTEAGRCTSCEPELWYSHRARGETERHVLAAWISAS